ncbi:folate-binding protein [Novosphingobium sp.]|uniref:CAF17-like 4Fe-4S cluster assembly/insertion protein YgfZ n=1 Tax=Novosphingobium sp. TaxID=1874826 RepID=UPI0026254DA8|nr:folate-binding protein [Novosphingobium sp.]
MSAPRLTNRTLVRISPLDDSEDVAAFLQGLVTNDVKGPLPVWAGLLSAQGKALFDFIVWGDGGDLLLDCEAAAAPALAKRLSLYRLRRRIAIAEDTTLGVYWRAEGEPTDPRLPALGHRWIAPVSADDVPADAVWLAHRLSLGVTEGLAELGSEQTLWLETNAADLAGVSFTKGCYVGQENTARMNWRQKVNRRLVVVPLAQSDPARQRAAYPELGLAVDHRRVEDISPETAPVWMDLRA